MYIPDPIERMESRIDDLIFEQFAGVPDGSIRCFGCSAIVPVDDAAEIGARPDAPAYCPECRKQAGVEW